MGRYVRVHNLTHGTSLAEHCRVASSLRDRAVGLLATPSLTAGEGLLIERTQSIHMFFMRYPIDVVFADRDAKVTRTVANLRPWRVVWWARGARDCVELPVGALQASGTTLGDQLRIDELG
jgi:uncharacterized membrane protein (UPF0127 family)